VIRLTLAGVLIAAGFGTALALGGSSADTTTVLTVTDPDRTVTLPGAVHTLTVNVSTVTVTVTGTTTTTTPAPADLFYVSPSGSDSDPGSQEAPWRTVQKAFDALEPGQTALVRDGNYAPATCGPEDSGTAGNDLTVRAYPGETPVISGDVDGVLRVACSYLNFQGFKLAGPSCVGCTIVYGKTGGHVTLADNEITGSVCQGVFLASVTSGWQILRNRIHDNGYACDRQAHGLYIEGIGHLVANNLIYDTHDYGIHVYPVAQDVRVLGNTVVRSGLGGLIMGGSGGVSGVTVANNIFAFNGGYGVRGYPGLASCTVQTNILYGNDAGPVGPNFPAGCVGANLTGDPQLEDDLRVSAGSPAVDTADPQLAVSPAFDGTARPQGAGPDIGAYER
jgi:parallel beta helix pectate lyase-like protein